MPPVAPPFPAFDDWKRMSERDQDALLDRLEAKKRRSTIAIRLLIGFGFGCVAVAAAIGLVLWALR